MPRISKNIYFTNHTTIMVESEGCYYVFDSLFHPLSTAISAQFGRLYGFGNGIVSMFLCLGSFKCGQVLHT